MDWQGIVGRWELDSGQSWAYHEKRVISRLGCVRDWNR